jgi:hypothetical protein
MPRKKGRKHRPRDRRESGAPEPQQAVAPPTPRRSPSDAAMPSATARATGFMIAVITAFLAVLTIADAFTSDRSQVDATLRIVAGVLLVLLAIVVGVLVLFPAQIRRRFRGE